MDTNGFEEQKQKLFAALMTHGQNLFFLGSMHPQLVQNEALKKVTAERDELTRKLNDLVRDQDILRRDAARYEWFEKIATDREAKLSVIEERHKDEIRNLKSLHLDEVLSTQEKEKQNHYYNMNEANKRIQQLEVQLEEKERQLQSKDRELNLKVALEEQKRLLDLSWQERLQAKQVEIQVLIGQLKRNADVCMHEVEDRDF